MRPQQWKAGLVVALLIAMAGSIAMAQAGGAAPAKAAPAAPAHEELFWPDMWRAFHNPTPWLSMGLDTRFRVETGQNWQGLNSDIPTDHNWLYQRYRSRWWTKWVLGEDITVNTRLVWEFRTWQDPEEKLQFVYPPGSENPKVTEFNPDEALFDWFNVNIRNIGGLPLTATLGRQDMIFGVGWLVLDASPLDGSRTIGLFDAARFTYDWAGAQTKVDVVYAKNSPESDAWLKPINDQRRGLMETKEQAGILYLTNTTWKPVQLEGFLIYKEDRPLGHVLTNFPYRWSQKGDWYTIGGAVSGVHAEHWKYRAEGAIETGTKYDPTDTPGTVGTRRDLEAFGALATLEYLFKDSHDNATHLTYEFASGDDPDTRDNERFDLLWGRWPRWSELFIFTFANETRVGDATNLHRLNLGHRINLTKKWMLTGDYHALWADENSGALFPTKIALSSTERFRGSLYAASLRYKHNAQLSGYALVEYFTPGEYYVAPSDDDAWFFRFNVEYIF
jgi:hypothetical protein